MAGCFRLGLRRMGRGFKTLFFWRRRTALCCRSGFARFTAGFARLCDQLFKSGETAFSLATIKGDGRVTLAFAGSTKSRNDALATYKNLISDSTNIATQTERFWEDYLAHTVSVELPDKDLEQAYDWSRLSLAKGMVDNPFLGRGLVAGYGPGKGTYRPGFAWFFGRDSFWSSFALNSVGDLANSRTAIELIAKFQRDDGKIPHEISQSASLVPWSQYPYEYASADATPLFIIAVRDYVEAAETSRLRIPCGTT